MKKPICLIVLLLVAASLAFSGCKGSVEKEETGTGETSESEADF